MGGGRKLTWNIPIYFVMVKTVPLFSVCDISIWLGMHTRRIKSSIKSLINHHTCHPGSLYGIAGELKNTTLKSVGPLRIPFCVVGNSVQVWRVPVMVRSLGHFQSCFALCWTQLLGTCKWPLQVWQKGTGNSKKHQHLLCYAHLIAWKLSFPWLSFISTALHHVMWCSLLCINVCSHC